MAEPTLALTLRDLLDIRSRHDDQIIAASKQKGSAVGFKISGGKIDTAKPSIIVFVPRKVSPGIVPPDLQIPETYEANGKWCFTDVIETDRPGNPSGDSVPLSDENKTLVAALCSGKVGITGGIQIANSPNGFVGTAACAIKLEDGTLGLLSNRHVAGNVGQKIFHPTLQDFEIGTVRESPPLLFNDEARFPGVVDEADATYRVDCASIALLDHTAIAVKPGVHGIGPLGPPLEFSLDGMSPLGLDVISVGCARGLQRGTIFGFGFRYDDARGHEHADFLILGAEHALFTDHRDSGKLIVTDDGTHRPVALHFGGGALNIRNGQTPDSVGFATDINWILAKLKASIYRVEDTPIA